MGLQKWSEVVVKPNFLWWTSGLQWSWKFLYSVLNMPKCTIGSLRVQLEN